MQVEWILIDPKKELYSLKFKPLLDEINRESRPVPVLVTPCLADRPLWITPSVVGKR
jgi:hypothetical protein